MKQLIIIIISIISMFAITINAQDQSTRFEKQHKSKYVKSQLNQTEEMLLKSFESDHIEIIYSSLQTLRQLEQIFPDNDFSSLIDPLMKFVKDENMDVHVRILSAIALEGLHSNKGDKVIYDVAKTTKIQSVKDICSALSLESLKADLVKE